MVEVSALIISVAALAIAVYFSHKTAKYQLLSTSANLLTLFVAKYDSGEMKKARNKLAKRILDIRIKDDIDLGDDSEPILELFEEIAYLTRKKVLDAGMVWNHFFWSFERYYLALTVQVNLIDKTRIEQRSPTIYQEVDWLYEHLKKIEISENRINDYAQPSEEQIVKFLKAESRLM